MLLPAPLAAFTVSLCALFWQAPRETDRYLAASGVEHDQHKQDQFRFRRTAFYSQLKSKVDKILDKDTSPTHQPYSR
jgi:hypothetical protein